jgi:hypothetical protein
MVLKRFSEFLQAVADKLRNSITLDMGITLVELQNIQERTLKINLKLLLKYLNIRDKSFLVDFIDRNLPSILQYADIGDLFNPQAVYQLLDSLLLWDGLTKILEYAVKYYDTNDRNTKNSLIDDMMTWSSNLASLATSNYFEYLECPELNDTTKAYIIHQVSLCSVHKIN